MDAGTLSLLAATTLLVAHHLVMNNPNLIARDDVFRGLQVAEVSTGVLILALGLPGLGAFPAARWLLGLLFLHHAVQNHLRRPVILADIEEGRL